MTNILSDTQKELIENEYKEFRTMGEHGYCNGMLFMLQTLGEHEFLKHLQEKYD